MGIDVTQKLTELLKYADMNGGNANGKYLDTEKEVSVFADKLQESVTNGELTADEAKEIWGLSSQYKAPDAINTDLDEEFDLGPQQKYNYAVRTYVNELNAEQKSQVTEKFNSQIYDVQSKTQDGFMDTLMESGLYTRDLEPLDDAIFHDIERVANKYIDKFHKFTIIESRIERYPAYQGYDYPEGYDKNATVNDIANEVFGCSYYEYIGSHRREQIEIMTAWAGKSYPEQVEVMQNFSQGALEYIQKSQEFEARLKQLASSEQDRLQEKANDKMDTEAQLIEEDIENVRLNETAESMEDFRSLNSRISQTLFTIDVALVQQEINGQSDIQVENNSNTRKIMTRKGMLIETTNPDGSKSYVDLMGRPTTLE